jgi:hypothetical protein
MMKVKGLILVLLAIVGWLVAVMPGVYGHLRARQQVAVYGCRMRIIPFASEAARSAIAHNGMDAANALAVDLERARPALLPSESAYILAMIQHRGTSLRNTAAERALKALLSSRRATNADIIAGRFALDAIEKDVRLPPALRPR